MSFEETQIALRLASARSETCCAKSDSYKARQLTIIVRTRFAPTRWWPPESSSSSLLADDDNKCWRIERVDRRIETGSATRPFMANNAAIWCALFSSRLKLSSLSQLAAANAHTWEGLIMLAPVSSAACFDDSNWRCKADGEQCLLAALFPLSILVWLDKFSTYPLLTVES